MDKMDELKNAILETHTAVEVSEELDRLLIRQLELIQEYADLSRENEVHQKDGYLNLAKSRYIQGSHSISQIRLPTEESEEYSAVITVTNEEKEGNSENNFEKIRPDNDNRNLQKPTIPSPIKRAVLEDKDSAAEAKLLRQFGVLSSGSVKTAQKGFRKSIEICIDRINVAEELYYIQQKFNALHKVKKQIAGESIGLGETEQ